MKKILTPILVIVLLFSIYTYLNNKCVSFGYDNIVFSTQLLCVKTTVSEEFQYKTAIYTPLQELEGDAENYIPKPAPVPTLKARSS